MRPIRIVISSLILLLPLCLLGIGSYRLVNGVFAFLNSSSTLAAAVSVEATRALHRNVEIHQVVISGNLWGMKASNTVELKDVVVSEKGVVDQHPFAHANSVVLHYTLDQVLYGNAKTPYITDLQLIRPTVSLDRNSSGKWNFADLEQTKGGGARVLTDHISVTGGTVLVHDARFPVAGTQTQRPINADVRNITGVAQIHPDKSVAFDFGCLPDFAIAHSVHAAGIVVPSTMNGAVHIQAAGLNLPSLFERFVPPRSVRLTSGSADMDLSALYSPLKSGFDPSHLSLSGSVKLTNLDGSSPALAAPFHSSSCELKLSDTSCSADLSGSLGPQPLHIVADVAGLPQLSRLANGFEPYRKQILAHEPIVNIETTVANSDLARLYRLLKIESILPPLPPVVTESIRGATAIGTVSVRLSGPLNNPTGGAVCHLTAGRYAQVSAKNIDGSATLSNHVIVAGVKGAYAGGDANIKANIDLDGVGAFSIEARGRNMHLESIGFQLNQLRGGTGDLDLAINGRKHRTPKITAQVQVQGLKLNDQTFQSAYGEAATVGRKLVFRTLRVDDPKGFALANGAINLSTHAVNMQVEADGLDIHSLIAAVTHSPPLAADPESPSLYNAEGVAYLRGGSITGTYEQPVLNGDLSAFGVSTGKYAVDKAVAAFRLSKSGIVIGKGSLERYPSIIEFTGGVTDLNDPRPSFDFNVQARDIDIANICNILGLDSDKFMVAGTISTDDPAGIRVFGSKGDIRVQNVNTSGDNKSFGFSLHRASINGLKLTTASALAFYDGSGIHLTSSNIEVAGGTLHGSGTISRDGKISAEIVGSSLSIAKLTSLLKDPLAPELDGSMGLMVHVSGTPQALEATADHLSVDNLKYRDLVVGSLSVGDANYAGNMLNLHDVVLTDPTTHSALVQAPELLYDRTNGTLSSPPAVGNRAIKLVSIPFSEIDAVVHAINNTDQEKTPPITLADVHGGLSATLGLSGTLDNPSVDVLLNTHNLSVRGYVITSLTGHAAVTKEGVSGETALMTIRPEALPAVAQAHPDKQDASISVRDYVVLKSGDLKADVAISNVNLAFVQSAIDPTAANQVTGVGDKILITARGTLKSPKLDVSLNLSNVGYMDRVFDLVSADHVHIEEGRIGVDSVVVTKTDSQSKTFQAAISGAIDGFSWTSPYLPDSAVMDVSAEIPKSGTSNDRIDLKLLTDLGMNLFRDSVGTFGGKFRLAGPITAPRIVSGSLGVTVDRVKIPGIQTQITGLDAAFSVANDVMTVDKFTARTQSFDRKGVLLPKRTSDAIRLAGSIPVGYGNVAPAPVSNPLTLSADAIQFEEAQIPGSKTGGLMGSAAVRLTATRSLLRPVIAGNVNLTNSAMTLPNDFSPNGGSGVTPTFNPRFDITVNLEGKNNRLTNQEVDARVGGAITFRGDLGSPVIHGRIDLNKGILRVPPRQFDIVPPGRIDLDYGNTAVADSGLNVRINLTARTKLTAVSLAGIRKLYTVTVTADGPLTEGAGETASTRMHLDFTTQPNDLAINQQDLSERLVTAIFGVDTFSQVGQNPGAVAVTALSNLFTGYVLPGEFNRFVGSLGLDQLAIGYDPYLQPSLIVSRQIAGPLYVTYNQAFTADTRYYDVKFSFRFHDRYQLSYDFDELHTQQFLLEGVWRY